MKAYYLFIFEDGSVGWRYTGPEEIDWKSINDGVLKVIDLRQFRESIPGDAPTWRDLKQLTE